MAPSPPAGQRLSALIQHIKLYGNGVNLTESPGSSTCPTDPKLTALK